MRIPHGSNSWSLVAICVIVGVTPLSDVVFEVTPLTNKNAFVLSRLVSVCYVLGQRGLNICAYTSYIASCFSLVGSRGLWPLSVQFLNKMKTLLYPYRFCVPYFVVNF